MHARRRTRVCARTFAQNNTENFCVGLAEIIGAGDWRLFYLYRDRLEKLTLADVQNALHKYYLPSNRTWGAFIPDKSADTERVVIAERPNISTVLNNYKGKPTVAKTETFEVSIPNIKKHIRQIFFIKDINPEKIVPSYYSTALPDSILLLSVGRNDRVNAGRD